MLQNEDEYRKLLQHEEFQGTLFIVVTKNSCLGRSGESPILHFVFHLSCGLLCFVPGLLLLVCIREGIPKVLRAVMT